MAGLYDLDIEAELLDDVARGWDDPDQSGGSSVAAAFASETDAAQTATRVKSHLVGVVPKIVGIATSANVASGGSFNIPLAEPTDLLYVFAGSSAGAISIDDWGSLSSGSPGGGIPSWYLAQIAPFGGGGEPDVITNSLGNPMNVVVFVVRGGPLTFDDLDSATGTSATPDPPAVTFPNETSLVFEMGVHGSQFVSPIVSSGYTGLSVGSAGGIALGWRYVTGASEDPGPMQASGSFGWATLTMALNPSTNLDPGTIETDTARDITRNKSRTIGLASETDTANTIIAPKRVTVTHATETDAAQAITALKTVAVGLASETDAAQTISAARAVTVSFAAETDAAQTIAWSPKARLVGVASETDAAQTITALKTVTVGLASEADEAQTVRPAKGRTVGWAKQPLFRTSANTISAGVNTTTTINLPSGIEVGDLLLMVLTIDASITTTAILGGSTWALLGEQTGVGGNTVRVYARIATGSDATSLGSSPTGGDLAVVTARFSGHAITSASSVPITSAATGTSNNPNPPAIDLGSVLNAIYVEMFGADDDDNSASYQSSGYTQIAQAESAQAADSVMSAMAYRAPLGTTRYEDPGTMGMSAAEEWAAFTVGLHGEIFETDEARTITPHKTLGRASETDEAQAITVLKTRAVGLASESDTAQAITLEADLTLGLASETDAAQTMTSRKTKLINEVALVETDTAQAITGLKTKLIGFAAETDSAQTIDVDPQRRLVGFASETDAAQAVEVDPQRRLIGFASETDEAQTVDEDPQRRLIGFAVETDSAQIITAPDTLGTALETDTAQTVSVLKTRLVGLASETDTAQAVQPLKSKAIGHASETDSAQTIEVDPQRRLIGHATETDTAQTVTSRKTKLVDFASETDTARTITAVRSVAVGHAVETDTAQAMTSHKTKLIDRANESDEAQPITSPDDLVLTHATETDEARTILVNPYHRLVSFASETDAAQTITARKTAAAGFVSETDEARAVTSRKTTALVHASETDTARTITARKTKAITHASETDAAQTVSAVRRVAVTHASEADTAQAITSHKTKLIGIAAETDLAQPIAQVGEIIVAVGVASETDLTQAITSHKRKAITRADETDTAQLITVRRSHSIGRADETDSPQSIARLKTVAVGFASETDLARVIDAVRTRVVAVLAASETDLAQALTTLRSRTIGTAIETDLAQTVLPIGGKAFLNVDLELTIIVPGLELIVLPVPLLSLDVIGNTVTMRTIADDLGLEIIAGEIN